MQKIPFWIKISYTLMVCVIVPVYAIDYPLTNFLWLSDVGLILMVPALWFNHRLISSMMALGVLPFELLWLIDLILGGRLGMTSYMFEGTRPLYLKLLSLYHLPLIAVIAYMLIKLGYDKGALLYQSILMLILFPLTYWLADPKIDNVNWVFGLGEHQQTILPPLLYLFLFMIFTIFLIYIPLHYLYKKLFTRSS